MSKRKVLVVCPKDHYLLRNFEPLNEHAEIFVAGSISDVTGSATEAEIVVYVPMHRVPALGDLWPHLKQVRWIHSLAAGVERALAPAIVESPVVVTNARGVFKRPLAEFAVLGALFFYKEVRRLIDSQNRKNWDDFYVRLAVDRVAAIVGYGEIGRECALLLKGLGMKIYATRRQPEKSLGDSTLDRSFAPAELHEMLRESDFVIAAAPLTRETHHMLSDNEFAAMKNSAIVMNVGRGPVIDEAALVRALQSQQIAGAALDVFEHEPLPPESPLWDMPNVLISPHCTDRTQDPDWLDLSAQLFVRNFERYRKGEPLENVVDKHAGY